MAESSIGPRLQVTGEKEFKSAMAGVTNEFKMLGSEMQLAVSQFDRNDKSTEALTAQNEVLGKQIDSQKGKISLLTTQYDKQNAKLSTLQTSLEATREAFGADSAEVARAQTAYDRQNNTVMALQTQLNGATTSLNNMERSLESNNDAINENSRDMGKFGEAVKAMGEVVVVGILTIGAAFVGATVAGVKMADDLTKSLNGVQAATGTSDADMGKMRETMLAIYNDNFGEGFEDIGDALTIVSQATGLTGDALKKATENALLLRDTFQMDVQESVVSVDTLMTQFGVTSEQAYNLLAQGAQNGLNKNEDMLDSINEYAGLYEEAGFSADEMFNMFSNGVEEGVQGTDKVADAFKEFSIRAKDGSETTQDAFKALKLDIDKTSKAFNEGGEQGKAAYEQVNKKLSEVKDATERNRIGVALYGTQWEDSGAKGVLASTNTKGAVDSTTDSLKKINDVKYDTFGEAMQGIKRNLQTGILLPLGQDILPVLQKFQTWIIANMPAIKNEISYAMEVAWDVFKLVGDYIKDVVIPAFKAFYDWIEPHIPAIKEFIHTAFTKIKEVLKVVGEFITDTLVPAFTRLYDWIEPHIPKIKETIKTAFELTGTAIDDASDAVSDIIDWFVKYKAKIIPIVEAVSIVIINAWAVTAAKAVASATIHGIQSLKVVANWLLMGVKSTFHALVVVASWVATSAGAIAAGIVMGVQAAIVVAKWAWMGVQATIQATKMAAAWVISMGPVAWAIAGVIAAGVLLYKNWDTIKEKASDLWTAVGNAFKKGVNVAIGWINDLIEMIRKIPGVDVPLISRIELEYTTNSKAKTMDDRLGNSGYKPGNNAQGTDYWRGGLTWVGERGPELIKAPGGSQIFSNSDSMAMAGGYRTANIYLQLDGQTIMKALGEPLRDLIIAKTGLSI